MRKFIATVSSAIGYAFASKSVLGWDGLVRFPGCSTGAGRGLSLRTSRGRYLQGPAACACLSSVWAMGRMPLLFTRQPPGGSNHEIASLQPFCDREGLTLQSAPKSHLSNSRPLAQRSHRTSAPVPYRTRVVFNPARETISYSRDERVAARRVAGRRVGCDGETSLPAE
jgi:hypothetical protein